jgi:hypothetical protein
MQQPVSLELHLEERLADRVTVAVTLAPTTDAPLALGGVAVTMFNRKGDSLSPRLLLPIAGVVHHRMVTSIELRAVTEIGVGSYLRASAWWEGGQLSVTCPTERWTELRCHMRGKSLTLPTEEDDIGPLSSRERRLVAAVYPWVNDRMLRVPERPFLESSEADEEASLDEEVHAFCTANNLCDEDEAFLKELLESD